MIIKEDILEEVLKKRSKITKEELDEVYRSTFAYLRAVARNRSETIYLPTIGSLYRPIRKNREYKNRKGEFIKTLAKAYINDDPKLIFNTAQENILDGKTNQEIEDLQNSFFKDWKEEDYKFDKIQKRGM